MFELAEVFIREAALVVGATAVSLKEKKKLAPR